MKQNFTLLVALLSVGCVSTSAIAAKPAAVPPKKAPVTRGGVSEEEFMRRFSEKIDRNLGKPDARSQLETTVLIKIDRDGLLKGVTIDKPSGDPEADAAALAAVKKAAPFGPMPLAYKTGLNMHFTIRFGQSANRGDFEPYMNQLRDRILKVWKNPEPKTMCQATVSFTLDKNGNIKQASLKQSSGFKNVDDLAIAAIRQAAPYGPLPDQNVDNFPIDYTLVAGPPGADVQQYQLNGVPLPKAGFQVSRGGSTLKSADLNRNIDRRLEARQFAIKDRIESLIKSIATTTDPRQVSDMTQDLAKCYSDIHDYDEAARILSDAAAAAKQTDAAGEVYASFLSELAEVHSKAGRFDDAEKEFAESVSILRSNSTGSNRAKFVEILTNYAKVLYKNKKAKEADELYKEIRSQ